MRPIQIPEQSESKSRRWRNCTGRRAMCGCARVPKWCWLPAEQHMTAAGIAAIVRESEGTVRCWHKRYLADQIAGLQDAWAGGAPAKMTEA
jgi:hypothetical protein